MNAEDWVNILGWSATLFALTFLAGYIRYRAAKETDDQDDRA